MIPIVGKQLLSQVSTLIWTQSSHALRVDILFKKIQCQKVPLLVTLFHTSEIKMSTHEGLNKVIVSTAFSP